QYSDDLVELQSSQVTLSHNSPICELQGRHSSAHNIRPVVVRHSVHQITSRWDICRTDSGRPLPCQALRCLTEIGHTVLANQKCTNVTSTRVFARATPTVRTIIS